MIEDQLREELQATLVPFDAARAEEMIRAATMSRHRAWVAPTVAAAAVVAVAGTYTAFAHSSSDRDAPAAAGSRAAAGTASGSTAPPVTTPTSTPTAGDATSFRVSTHTAPGTTQTFPGPAIQDGARLTVTALVLDNPGHRDRGTIKIARGSEVLLELSLARFESLDYHFEDPPLVFTASQPLEVEVTCANATSDCTPSVLFLVRTGGQH